MEGHWELISAFGVFFLQVGFVMLEVGLVRDQNTADILVKNVLDACVSALIWYAVGFGFAFGPGRFWGDSLFFECPPELRVKKFHQWTFACAAQTIVAGAVAERCHFHTYIVYSIVVSALVYPIVCHAIWNEEGWLRNLVIDGLATPFHDHAGGCVVHIVGGCSSLVGAILLGPRFRRFKIVKVQGEMKRVVDLIYPGQSSTLVVCGSMILWFSWFFFNTGVNSDQVEAATVAMNSALSGASSALMGALMYSVVGNGVEADVIKITNCLLSGLVAVTGSCDVIPAYAAILTGIAAAWVFFGCSNLLIKYGIDDPADCVSVHMGAGTWGIFSIGLFHYSKGIFMGGGGHQLAAQTVGIVTTILYVGLLGLFAFGFVLLLDRRGLCRFRRTFWQELEGLSPELTVREREYRENFRQRKKRACLAFRSKEVSSVRAGPIIVVEGKTADTTTPSQIAVDSENQIVHERYSTNSGAEDGSTPRLSSQYGGSPIIPRKVLPRHNFQHAPAAEMGRLMGFENGVRMGTSMGSIEGAMLRFYIEEELMFQLASDLHMEMWGRQKFVPTNNLWQNVIERIAPVLVLLGDISVCGDDEGFAEYRRFVTHQSKQFAMVVIVAGNHEYYSDPDMPVSVNRIKKKIKEFTQTLPHVYFLDDEVIEINGVLVFGTTLWSDIDKFTSSMIEESVNDFEMIYVEKQDSDYTNNNNNSSHHSDGSPSNNSNLRKLQVEDVRRWHKEALDRLKSAARQANAEKKKLVVLSHHAPTFQDATNPQDESSPLASAFCTNLEPLMDYGGTSETSCIHTWAFGHTHHCTDQKIQGVHVVSNQYGHSTPLPDYNEAFCFLVD